MSPQVNRRELLASASLAGGIALAGCATVWDSIVGRAACQEPALAATSSKPANKIKVEGMVEPFGDEPVALFHDAEIDDPDEGERYQALLERTGDEEAELVVPVHPADWMGGGTVELVFESEDGTVSCDGYELDIEPLESPSRTVDDIFDEIETQFETFSETFEDETGEFLETNVRELAPPLQGIAGAFQGIADPDNPTNLRAVLAGEAPALEAVETSPSITASQSRSVPVSRDSLGHSVELGSPAQRTASTQDAPDSDEVDEEDVDDLLTALIEEAELADRMMTALAEMVVLGEELYEIDLADEKVTPEELHRAMAVQSAAAELNHGASADLQEFAVLAAGSTSVMTGVTGVGAPVAAKLGAVGNVISYVGLALEGFEKGLPSELGDIEIDADPTSFKEDFSEEDTPGSWTADLEATSQPWTLEWINDVGTIPIAGPGAKFLSELGGFGQDAAEKMLLVFENFSEEIFGVHSDTGPLVVDSVTYQIEDGITPTREHEDEYFTWEIREEWSETGETPFVLDEDDASLYEPLAVGDATLRVRTVQDQFSGQFRESIEEVEVAPIDVEILDATTMERRTTFRLDPEESELTVDLVAEVENAHDEDVEWTYQNVRGPETGTMLTTGGPGNREATFDASGIDFSEHEEATYLIEVESKSEDGLREGRDPPREDEVYVDIGEEEDEFEVGPVTCVGLEDEHEFVVMLNGDRVQFAEINIEYDITGPGSLDSTGVFTPVDTGDVSIEFEHETAGGQLLTDTVSFEVTEECGNITIISERFSHSTDCVAVAENTGEDAATTLVIPSDEPVYGDIRFLDSLSEDLDGEWERELGFESGDIPYDPQLYADEDDVTGYTNPGPDYLERGKLRRHEREIDGQSVGVYSGHVTASLQGDTPPDGLDGAESVTTTIHYEFSGVLPIEYVDCVPTS